jgi:hypothetical protein
MRKLNWGLIISLVFCLAFWTTLLFAQMVPSTQNMPTQQDTSRYITVYYGVLMDAPRKMLDSLWSVDPNQVERGFCVGAVSYGSNWEYDMWGRKIGRDIVARVWSVFPAKVSEATPDGIENLDCPDGNQHIHTHPPTTCDHDNKNCVYGGMNAWQCQASRTDYMTLIRKGHRFGIIQCDRNAFRFYWPSEYRP